MESVASLAGVPNTELNIKISSLQKENGDLKKAIDDLRNLVISLQARVETLESTGVPKMEVPKVCSFPFNWIIPLVVPSSQ